MSIRPQPAIVPAAVLSCALIVVLSLWITTLQGIYNTAPAQDETGSKPLSRQVDLSTGAVEDADEAPCAVSAEYPEAVLQWCVLITRYAQENSLDPNLVAAMMLRESGGERMAVSKSGAVGLLQVMPSDGPAADYQCVNGPCFSSRPSTAELKEAEFNISYGTDLLAGLLAEKGDLREALRAYGPIEVGYAYADFVMQTYGGYR